MCLNTLTLNSYSKDIPYEKDEPYFTGYKIILERNAKILGDSWVKAQYSYGKHYHDSNDAPAKVDTEFSPYYRYWPGFHIWPCVEYALGYAKLHYGPYDETRLVKYNLYEVFYRKITAFGENETMDGENIVCRPCVIAHEMRLVQDLTHMLKS